MTGPRREGHRAGLATWQKVVAILGLVAVLALGALLIAGEGHGPGRHDAPTDGREQPRGEAETAGRDRPRRDR